MFTDRREEIMAEVKNLPAKSKANTLRAFFNQPAVKQQLQMALPKHLTVDRLLRVAMTSIQRNPKLLECTQESLLACVMTCAQLGLEPDQFLGQAYLVPFKNTRKNAMECQLIPGYRGYIALARRSGEVQTVSSQVVYEKDHFDFVYGIEDKLEHRPNLNGDRGKPIGAYAIFKYKDGGYSFDFMPEAEIMKIRERSKSKDDGPWVTDTDEMRKKTVIKRHAKLAPMSIEFQKASALEDRAYSGESQMDILQDKDDQAIDAEIVNTEVTEKFAETFNALDQPTIAKYLEVCAAHFKKSVDEIKAGAVEKPDDFKKAFTTWKAAQDKKAQAVNGKKKETKADPEEDLSVLSGDCPNSPGTQYMKGHCKSSCKEFEGCPAWKN